jgi:single-strand DNA-binding protein
MYQSVTVVGRLGRDPEMRYMPDGSPVTSFSMATDRAYNDRNGQKQKETTWFRVSVFGKQAEVVNQYLSKGKMALVEGRLRVDPKTGGPTTFTRQDGTVGSSFEIVANTVRFLSAREEGNAGGGDMGGGEHGESGGGDGGDIPF